MSGSLMTLDSGAGGLLPQFASPSTNIDDLVFDADDTYYIGYDPDTPVCARPRQINVTRRIDLGGTSNSYDPVLNLLSAGTCASPTIDARLNASFNTNIDGITTPVELWADTPYPLYLHSDRVVGTGELSAAVIVGAQEAVADAGNVGDHLVDFTYENGAGNALHAYLYTAASGQLVARSFDSDDDWSDWVGFGVVPRALLGTDQGAARARAGLEGLNDARPLTLWSINANGAYSAPDAGLGVEIMADINAAAINADYVVLALRWRDNVDAETDLFRFKEEEIEIVGTAQAAVLGTSSDGAAAVGVQIGAESDYTTDGARCVEFVDNTTTVKGFIDLNGDLGFNMEANGQQVTLETLTELTTIDAAANTSTTIQIPADALVYAVSARVVTVIPTATTFDVGVSGAVTRYGTGLSVAAGTTNPGTDDSVRYYGSAISILITPDASPAAATGQVRITIHFFRVTPPTS